MDSLSKDHRCWNISKILSNDTKPGLLARSFLFRHGFRYRLHVKDLPGKPDIVLPKYRTVIEIRGCFWHRHPGCKEATTPSTNVSFWNEKVQKNVDRDQRTVQELEKLGWHLIVVWECETRGEKIPPPALIDFIMKERKYAQKEK